MSVRIIERTMMIKSGPLKTSHRYFLKPSPKILQPMSMRKTIRKSMSIVLKVLSYRLSLLVLQSSEIHPSQMSRAICKGRGEEFAR